MKDLGRYSISFCFTDGYSPTECRKFRIIVEGSNRPKKVSKAFTKYKAQFSIRHISRDGIV